MMNVKKEKNEDDCEVEDDCEEKTHAPEDEEIEAFRRLLATASSVRSVSSTSSAKSKLALTTTSTSTTSTSTTARRLQIPSELKATFQRKLKKKLREDRRKY